MDLMKAFTEKYTKAEPPKVSIGDTVRVHLRVKEGNRERIQVFEGTVIAKKHGGIEESFTVRRISASASRRCSPSTPPLWKRSRWSAGARCAAPSCTTCATAWARPPRSRNCCDSKKERLCRSFFIITLLEVRPPGSK